MLGGILNWLSIGMKGVDPLPNVITVEIRGNIKEYFQGIREEIPLILGSFIEASTQQAAEMSPGGSSGGVGGTLSPEPARPTGPNTWEGGIVSSDAKKVYWHEFGTGERKGGGGSKYPITATKPHRMLVFEKEGAVRFIRGKAGGPAIVKHPGVFPTRMLRRAITALLPRYMDMFEELLKRTRVT